MGPPLITGPLTAQFEEEEEDVEDEEDTKRLLTAVGANSNGGSSVDDIRSLEESPI